MAFVGAGLAFRLYARFFCDMNSVLEMVSCWYAIQIRLLIYVHKAAVYAWACVSWAVFVLFVLVRPEHCGSQHMVVIVVCCCGMTEPLLAEAFYTPDAQTVTTQRLRCVCSEQPLSILF